MVITNFIPLGTHEKVYHFSKVKESKLEMLIFMDLDSINFRALQCGYNDVSDGNLAYTYSFVNHSDKEGMNYNIDFTNFCFCILFPLLFPFS